MKLGTIDKSNLPLVIIKINPCIPTVGELERDLEELGAVFQDHKGVAIIFEASESKFLPSDQRIMMGNWIKKNHNLIRLSAVCIAYVVPSFIGRTMLNGIFVVQQPPTPYKILATMPEAIEWSRAQAAKQLVN